jgi:membrane peptidoglycan carboxypeptidase
MLMTSMLAEVVQRGTGRAVRRAGFTGAAAGKTGTTDDYADAWFLGFTPTLTAGVWFGYDHPRTIRRSGYAATIAAPAWAEFMREATKGARAPWSYQFFGDVEPDRQGLPRCGTAPAAQVEGRAARSAGPTHASAPR